MNVQKGSEQETLGAVIRHAYFIHTFLITLTSVFFLLAMSFSNYWPSLCQHPDAALFGLIGGVYTLSITGLALLISTILVDDCSWFFKFFNLLISACLYVGCGMYHLYTYFNARPCSWVTPTNVSREMEFSCYKHTHEYSPYTPFLIFMCILAGVVYFLFAVYLVLSFDAE